MVSQLLRLNLDTSSYDSSFSYIRDVYEVCLERHCKNLNYNSWRNAHEIIQRGRKVLQSEEEVDTYIAFYGAHHYYKLVEAFDALNILSFRDRELEIISYGCGAATDICTLISYCYSKQISLPFKKLVLIEPSQIALDRGINYINYALSDKELNKVNIIKIHKNINQIQKQDIIYNSKSIKIHVFSNILDIQEIDLVKLSHLIKETQNETNYFICVNPNDYLSKIRIDNFYNEISKAFKISNISTNSQKIIGKKFWMMKEGKYVNNYSIHRYHRIFKAERA